MEPDDSHLTEAVTPIEDNRGPNTRITHDAEKGIGQELEREQIEDDLETRDGPESEVEEPFEQFSAEVDLESDSTDLYHVVDATDVALGEEGLPEEPSETLTKARNYMIDQVGYNPETEDFDTFGEISITYHHGNIDVFYELSENLTSPDGLEAPIVHNAGPEILEQAMTGEVPHTLTQGYESEDATGVQFRYHEDDWVIATEEIGDAITSFEEDLGLDSYSGR